MRNHEFESILKNKNYSYKAEKRYIVVNHQGDVCLSGLTTLPENAKFENRGYVDLIGLKGKHKYLGKDREFRNIDGATMLILSAKKIGDCAIIKAKYFAGGRIKDMESCYIAERGKYSAHGETAKQAIEDVNFKFRQEEFDVKNLVASIKKSGIITKNDYRLLTGACSFGVDKFKEDHNLLDEKIDLEKVKKLVAAHYGGDKFIELFS